MNESRSSRIARVLLRAGRAGAVPEPSPHFETRLLAAIREQRGSGELPWLLWNRVVWRLVPVMAAVVLALAWFAGSGSGNDAALPDPFGFDLALADHFLGGGR